jgi:hypothetical protein
MTETTRVVRPGPGAGTVRADDGTVLPVPTDWALLEPGDAGLTRRVKAGGPSWTVQEKRGRKVFSRGVWAPAAVIAAARAALEGERSTDAYARKREAAERRRTREQAAYVTTFEQAVLDYLAFAPCHADIAARLARAVCAHATPVGSGTVARTRQLPVEKRAELAVIAWLRHQTTAYDAMHIPRVRGKRREVRRALAGHSKVLLARYRRGESADPTCPLQAALTAGQG